MATLLPGALWLPIPVSPTRPLRRKGRAVIFHVAVSEAPSLFGLFSSSPNDSHLYVRRDGTVEQYVDLDLESYASMAANASTISVETQGGVTNPDGEPWTAAQLTSLARIARWAHDTEGVPLQLMPDSLPASRGIGWHRLGIDPWRVSGGEVWSATRGKLCPGAAKIAQVPQILALAQGNPQEVDLLPDEREWLRQVVTVLGHAYDPTTHDDIGTRITRIDQLLSSSQLLDAQALADDIVGKLPAADAAKVADLVITGLGQRINTPPAPA